ncbi:hypothetical protein LMG23992_01916 [Cupriavidus laharis]|uniref:Alanine dehydrogenase/pyridine nucleotide transhydrogenase NAD(H)-binding domain-containing protein n=1 Tax=Cupriavidus laharis TaxID=151654 RepID=A0ABM8WU81_9BURK|nr:hypothetical protein LMG23992_01916 [Cupriavidus laharis]
MRTNKPPGQGGTLLAEYVVNVSAYFTRQPRPDLGARVKDWPKGGKPNDARWACVPPYIHRGAAMRSRRGRYAIQIAVGMGARVTVLDRNVDRLRHLGLGYGNRLVTLYSSADAIERALLTADAVIGAVLVTGDEAPKLVTRAMVARMKAGSVVVDVAIDQGGCCETSRPTSHTDPVYVVDGVLHYCVTNMPAAVARTSTFALNNATIGYAMAIADKGWSRALGEDPCLRAGLNICRGNVTYAAASALACRATSDMGKRWT